ncbi:hypothetical protein [Aestuariicoccus sp. MJ-SS9]|uniref:hypothetical protein n=1 Tax=Aestuariicoccus sp. MJ-SS9 TaxID=3079855 RepID=UPI002908F4C5|nr:hypothetical protein [Aestuariicoccus sp. MJ-SS9]MDU8913551.1 hypothetical protein [Aestuariicoccus sp. MJ-SS9]
MIDTSLQAFRKDQDGCEIVAFADVAARTVLAWDSALKWPQEHLDALCDLAARALSVGAEGPQTDAVQTAIIARPTGCHVFVRAAPGLDEVLCCVFAPGADIDGVLSGAVQLCASLSGAGQRERA